MFFFSVWKEVDRARWRPAQSSCHAPVGQSGGNCQGEEAEGCKSNSIYGSGWVHVNRVPEENIFLKIYVYIYLYWIFFQHVCVQEHLLSAALRLRCNIGWDTIFSCSWTWGPSLLWWNYSTWRSSMLAMRQFLNLIQLKQDVVSLNVEHIFLFIQ